MNNLLSSIPATLSNELTEAIVQAKHVRIERIVSHGQASPEGFWYDEEENEFVLLVQGAARLRFENSVLEMKPGDWLNIPSHRTHRVEWTTPMTRRCGWQSSTTERPRPHLLKCPDA